MVGISRRGGEGERGGEEGEGGGMIGMMNNKDGGKATRVGLQKSCTSLRKYKYQVSKNQRFHGRTEVHQYKYTIRVPVLYRHHNDTS